MQSAGGAAFDEAAPRALHRGGMHMQGGRDLGIGLVLVGGEQDAGAGEHAGRGNALVEEAQEFGAFAAGEVDVVALEHGSCPPSDQASLHPLNPSRSSSVALD